MSGSCRLNILLASFLLFPLSFLLPYFSLPYSPLYFPSPALCSPSLIFILFPGVLFPMLCLFLGGRAGFLPHWIPSMNATVSLWCPVCCFPTQGLKLPRLTPWEESHVGGITIYFMSTFNFDLWFYNYMQHIPRSSFLTGELQNT